MPFISPNGIRLDLKGNFNFESADFTGWTLSGNADYTSATPNTCVFGAPHSVDYAA